MSAHALCDSLLEQLAVFHNQIATELDVGALNAACFAPLPVRSSHEAFAKVFHDGHPFKAHPTFLHRSKPSLEPLSIDGLPIDRDLWPDGQAASEKGIDLGASSMTSPFRREPDDWASAQHEAYSPSFREHRHRSARNRINAYQHPKELWVSKGAHVLSQPWTVGSCIAPDTGNISIGSYDEGLWRKVLPELAQQAMSQVALVEIAPTDPPSLCNRRQVLQPKWDLDQVDWVIAHDSAPVA